MNVHLITFYTSHFCCLNFIKYFYFFHCYFSLKLVWNNFSIPFLCSVLWFLLFAFHPLHQMHFTTLHFSSFHFTLLHIILMLPSFFFPMVLGFVILANSFTTYSSLSMLFCYHFHTFPSSSNWSPRLSSSYAIQSINTCYTISSVLLV